MIAKPFGLSVKALVRDMAGRFLVMHRPPESHCWPARWDLPGGKVEPGETFDAALLRETLEETHLEIELERYVGGVEWELSHIRIVVIVMLATVRGGEVQISKEHDAWRWVDATELLKMQLVDPLAQVLSIARLDATPLPSTS